MTALLSDNASASGGAIVVASEPDSEDCPPPEYDAHGWLKVVGHGWIVAPKHCGLVAPETVLAAADIESLHAAMLVGRCCGALPEGPETISVALDSVTDFRPQASEYDDVELYVDASGVYGQCHITSRRRPPWSRYELARLLRPAQRRACTRLGDPRSLVAV